MWCSKKVHVLRKNPNCPVRIKRKKWTKVAVLPISISTLTGRSIDTGVLFR